LNEIVPEIQVPFGEARGRACYHFMPVLLPKEAHRLEFMEGMKAEGVQTSIHYPPVHTFSAYAGGNLHGPGDLKVTEQAAGREVTLPLYPGLADSDVTLVVKAVCKVLCNREI
jgi:dTDP-4-amino-4,6-dideoxygalactose transaminase